MLACAIIGVILLLFITLAQISMASDIDSIAKVLRDFRKNPP